MKRLILLLVILSLVLVTGCNCRGEDPDTGTIDPEEKPDTEVAPTPDGGSDVEDTTTPPVTYTVSYQATTGGKIVGEATQTVTEGGSTTSVTATAESGWVFLGWSDGFDKPERSDSNVKSNLECTARFAKENTSDGGVDLPDMPLS